MFKRILIAVDSSETAALVLQTALGLAAGWQAQLRIVHVVDLANINLGADFVDQPRGADELVKRGGEILERAGQTAASSGVAFESQLVTIETLRPGVADAIASDAEAWAADLIVIGTHGRRGLQRLVLGSVAEGVARAAAVPVLLVRGK
jgi:nucleotide-binding universal stress UspA family protein